MPDRTKPFALLAPPYAELVPVSPDPRHMREVGRRPGSALVWWMGSASDTMRGQLLRSRPGGLALLAILPKDTGPTLGPTVAQALSRLRPQGVLPFYPSPSGSELAQLLRRPPIDLGGEVTDYVRWRGISIDRDTTALLRRILDLSADLRSVSAVSRSMYISRRALGRRLTSRGLPVPSHWLQVGRLLRVACRLQNSEATIASVAFEHGYPDGFALSNQMERLTGHRPSEVRLCLGWEWLVERWLCREAEAGALRGAAAPRQVPHASVQPKGMFGPGGPPRHRRTRRAPSGD